MVFDPRLLTPHICDEVFQYFLLHFSAELPFIHQPTFQPLLANISSHPNIMGNRGSNATPTAPSADRELLFLGILSLAAQFHPVVVHHYAPGAARQSVSGRDAVVAEAFTSEFYASALRHTLFSNSTAIIRPSLAYVQALLMLSLYETGRGHGSAAYMCLGLAVRGASVLELHREDARPHLRTTKEVAWLGLQTQTCYDRDVELLDPDSTEAFVDEEMRRRTFWSCLFLDQYLSGTESRPAMIRPETLRLQLPCGEKAWVFGSRTATRKLDGSASDMQDLMKTKRMRYKDWLKQRNQELENHTSGEMKTTGRVKNNIEVNATITEERGENESLLSGLVRAVELWGKVIRGLCAGDLQYIPHLACLLVTTSFANLICTAN